MFLSFNITVGITIVFLVFSTQAQAVCYKHLQAAENDEAFMHVHYSKERSVLHSSLRQVIDTALLPAELPYIAKSIGLDGTLQSLNQWTRAALEVRSKRIKENLEKVSFVLEDAALIQNKIEAFWAGTPDPELDFSYNRPMKSEAAIAEKRKRIQELEKELTSSGEIPSLLVLWEQIDGSKRGLDLLSLTKILLLSNYYELLCPVELTRTDDMGDELRYQATNFSELKEKLLNGSLIDELRDFGHSDIPSLNQINSSYTEDLLSTAKSFVTAPLSVGANLWSLSKEFRNQLNHTKKGSDGGVLYSQAAHLQLTPEKQLAIQRLVFEDSFHRAVRQQLKNDPKYFKKLLDGDLDQDFRKELQSLTQAHEEASRIPARSY